VLGGMKQSLDSQRRTVENAINAVKAAGVAPGSRSVSHSKGGFGVIDRKLQNYEMVKSTKTVNKNQEEDMA